jgi:hypothetical protein
VVIDARNLEQRSKACLAILAILKPREDGRVELSDRPTELNAIRVGGICQFGTSRAVVSNSWVFESRASDQTQCSRCGLSGSTAFGEKRTPTGPLIR